MGCNQESGNIVLRDSNGYKTSSSWQIHITAWLFCLFTENSKRKILFLKIELLCRRKKEPQMAHNLENPCYVQTCDAAPTNNLGGCEENDYATCHIESNGNVYVEFGDSQPSCQSGTNCADNYKIQSVWKSKNGKFEIAWGCQGLRFTVKYIFIDHSSIYQYFVYTLIWVGLRFTRRVWKQVTWLILAVGSFVRFHKLSD